jgi:predicted CopG family antitoxin
VKTITVKDETHAELTIIGKKGESYDDIIQRLIRDYKIYVED